MSQAEPQDVPKRDWREFTLVRRAFDWTWPLLMGLGVVLMMTWTLGLLWLAVQVPRWVLGA